MTQKAWDTPFGALELEETFVFYDGPRLFTCRAKAGALYLAMFADESESHEDWLIAAITQAQLDEAKDGFTDLRTLLTNATSRGAFLLRHDATSDQSAIVSVFAREIPGQYLPAEAVSLAPSIKLQTSLAPRLVQKLSVRRFRRTLGDLSLAAVGKVTEVWSSLLGSFEVNDTELGELVALGASTGSVVLELGSHNPKLVPRAVKEVVEALAISATPKKMRTELRKLAIDPFQLLALLELVSSEQLHVSVETIGVDQPLELDASRAKDIAKQLRDALSLMLDTAEVPQADTLTRMFRLVEATAKGNTISEASTGIVQRQISYYRQAARLLGFLDSTNAISSIGENLVSASASGRFSLTATQFENSRCGAAWLKWASAKELPSLRPESAAPFLKEVTLLSESTADRRAKTLSAWLIDLREYHYSKAKFS